MEQLRVRLQQAEQGTLDSQRSLELSTDRENTLLGELVRVVPRACLFVCIVCVLTWCSGPNRRLWLRGR